MTQIAVAPSWRPRVGVRRKGMLQLPVALSEGVSFRTTGHRPATRWLANRELDRDRTAMKAELLKQAYLTGRRNFSHSHLQNICLHKAYLAEINFSNAYLNRAILSKTNFERAYLNRAILYAANLSHAHLYRTSLIEANLEKANLARAVLNHANLSGANFKNANLQNAQLVWANLRSANFKNANLDGVNFAGARFFQTIMPDGSIWND